MWIILVILTAFLVLTSQFSQPVIKRHILMVVAVITMQVTRGKRDGGGNAVASSGGNSQCCGNDIVSAGLWLYYSYIFNLTTAAIFSMQHSASVCVRISRLHVDQ